MAFDEEAAGRIRRLLSGRSDVREQKLMGGLSFMVRGHMCCAVSGRGGLLIRVGPDAYPSLLGEAHAAPVEMRGRAMTGFLRVAPEGYRTAAGLKRWVTRATDFVATLPKKVKKKAPRKAPRRSSRR
jgi:TfoX/Sxy family transcriptional regulator of competence genes